MNYREIIYHKYGVTEDAYRVERRPRLIDGKPTTDFNDWEFVLTRWDVDAPQPTIAELDAHAQDQEYLDWLAQLATEQQEEDSSKTKAEQLLTRIATERQWLQDNWDDLDTAAKLRGALSRVMKENEEILQVLYFLIRRATR